MLGNDKNMALIAAVLTKSVMSLMRLRTLRHEPSFSSFHWWRPNQGGCVLRTSSSKLKSTAYSRCIKKKKSDRIAIQNLQLEVFEHFLCFQVSLRHLFYPAVLLMTKWFCHSCWHVFFVLFSSLETKWCEEEVTLSWGGSTACVCLQARVHRIHFAAYKFIGVCQHFTDRDSDCCKKKYIFVMVGFVHTILWSWFDMKCRSA